MKLNKSRNIIINIFLLLVINLFPAITYSAEKITLFKNIYSRSIYIKDLERFSKTGEAEGLLKFILKNQNKKVIRNYLTADYKAPVELTSRLLYSQIGEVILKRLSKILYPYRIPEESISVLAIKTATIKAIVKGNESINIINFLEAYPSKVIAIDVTELSKVLNKVESMSELAKFFTDSPLENLKN